MNHRPAGPSPTVWKSGTAPGIFPPLTHGMALFRRPLEFLDSLSAHGDLVEIRLGPTRAWVVCHPRLVHEMLRDTRTFDKGGPLYTRLRGLMGDGVVTCPHADHRRQRRLLQPAFRPARVARLTGPMGEEAEALCRGWRDGQEVDVSAAMMTVTTGVVSRVLFSDALDPARAAEVRDCLSTVVRGLFVRTVVPVDAFFRLPLPGHRRYTRAVARLRAIVDEVVARRRRTGGAHDDVLGTLLAAADGPDPEVTGREVQDQLVSLLLTGAESAALCLSSAFGLLALHPEAEQRMHAEVDTVLAGRARPTAEDLPRLVYTRSVVDESLRLAPPGWLFTRLTTREVEFGGRRLPAGATVLYSPYLLHHAPESFPDPERFLPERWQRGGPDGPFSPMVPFAAGSRKCLGDTFALAQATVTLATVARHWRLRHRPGPVPPLRPAVTLGPRDLVMRCERRPQQPGPAPATPAAGAVTAVPRARTAPPPAVRVAREAGDAGVHDA